ncbi:MAG: hypothetical protein R2713_22285 [Ilumatobacteraceae bacterium]
MRKVIARKAPSPGAVAMEPAQRSRRDARSSSAPMRCRARRW